MLKELRVNNFKTFLNATIRFGRRHLLIGRNSSGKTNLANAIRFLTISAVADLDIATAMVPGGIREMPNDRHRGDPIELSCTCEMEFQGEACEFNYELKLQLSSPSDLRPPGLPQLNVVGERLTLKANGFDNVALLNSDGREATCYREEDDTASRGAHTDKTPAPRDATMLARLYELPTNRRAILFRKFLTGWSYFALSPEKMRGGWAGKKGTGGSLDPAGDLLAYALYYLKNTDERRYRRVIEHAQIFEPGLQAINYQTSGDGTVFPSVAKDADDATYSWEGLSDGTLRALALGYIVEMSGSVPNALHPFPTLCVIEEPENGIFPGQLRALFDLFEERAPQGQFIFTSHSPYFINLFDAARKDVTILKRDGYLTRFLSARPADSGDGSPDRFTLAEEFSMELFD